MKMVPPPQVVVSGAAGFLGRAIVTELLDNGFHVIALVRRTPLGLHLAGRKGLQIVELDLTGPEAGYQLSCLPTFSTFVHAAGAPKFVGVTESELRTLHVGATSAVAAVCSARRSRLIHLSTAYVSPGSAGLLREVAPSPRHGANPYEVTKTEGEVVLAQSCHAPLDIVRPAIVCAGLNDSIAEHQASPAAVFLRLARRDRIIVPGDARTSLAFCDRQGVAHFVRTLAGSSAPTETRWWNLCGQTRVQLGDLCEEFSRLTGRPVELDRHSAGSRLKAWIPYLCEQRTWDCCRSKAWSIEHQVPFQSLTAGIVASQLAGVFNQTSPELAA